MTYTIESIKEMLSKGETPTTDYRESIIRQLVDECEHWKEISVQVDKENEDLVKRIKGLEVEKEAYRDAMTQWVETANGYQSQLAKYERVVEKAKAFCESRVITNNQPYAELQEALKELGGEK